MVQHHIVTNIFLILKSTMMQRCIVTKMISISKLIMVNHGPMSHCDKDCLNRKIKHGKPWSTMFILGFIIFILDFMYIGFIIFIPWVYNTLGF